MGLSACAVRASSRPPDPPPTGPFRTVTGAATHPLCRPPGRTGAGGAVPRCVVGFGRGTTAFTASPDGTQILVALLDVDPTAWSLPTVVFLHDFAPLPEDAGEEVHGEREGPQALVVAPDGRTALFAVEDRLIRYELASGKVLGDIEGPEGGGMIDGVAWSRDGRTLLVASAADGKARLLDAGNGRVLRMLPSDGRVVEMAFSDDGRRAAVGTDVGTVAIVDLRAATAKPRVLTPSTQEITGLGFVGTRLVVAARDGRVRLFDATTGDLQKQVDVGAPITRFALDRDGRLAATSDDQHVVRVLALPDGVVRHTFAWHQASITALGWGVGPTLLVADNDGELAAWDVSAPE
jgi:WD40 repeat protein